jgi:hypothetical protein
MPKLVPLNTIIVRREGKRIKPEIGKPFDFTAEEVAHINQVSPTSLRKVVNETGGGTGGAGGEGGNTNPPAKTDAQIAAETKAAIKGLLGADGAVPNMDTVNKALKAAELPNDLKAADRDAIIASIKAEEAGL